MIEHSGPDQAPRLASSTPPDRSFASSRSAGIRPTANASLGDATFAGAQLHLLHHLRVLYKRRWIACTAFLTVLLLVTVYVFTATPIYEGTARLLIERDRQNVVNFKPVVEEDHDLNLADSYYLTQYQLLEGRALAATTIDSLHLWNDLELCVPCRTRPQGLRGFVVSAIDAGVEAIKHTLQPSAPRAAENGTSDARRKSAVIDAFLERLVISPVKDSRLVDVKFRSVSPTVAARVANTHARGYIETDLDFKSSASKEASDWLRRQMLDQRGKVEQSEAAVQEYREHNNDGVSLEDRQNIVVQKLNDLSAAVTKAKTQRIEKEALYRQLQSIDHNQAALEAFPAILSNSLIQQLKYQIGDLHRQQAQLADRLGEKHPDMIKVTTEIQSAEEKLRTEMQKFVVSAQSDYRAAEAQERSLVDVLETQKHDALALNRKSIEGNVLKRDAESNRQVYDALLQRAKETGVSGELKTSNIRLVDLAEVPIRPASPNKTQDFMLALLGGGLLGVTLAVFFENLDDRIKTPDEIGEHLGVATLGLIPRATASVVGERPLISNGVPLDLSEAFRTLRTSVLFSLPAPPEGRPTVLVVTSTAPSEGKTTCASNLAVGIALAGKRVLLIDADMRKPSVHTMFGINQEPGMSNLLVGNALPSAVLQPSGVTDLWLLPAGHVPPNPSELLSSPRFEQFVSTLGNHFDWVVIDSAPVLAVTDASVIAHLVDGIVFVIGSEMTSRRAAGEAIDRLVRADGRMLGAVLNRVNISGHPYYYSHYYRREYGDYYASAIAR